MKRIVEINSVLHGSTGKITRLIAETAMKSGNQVMVCVPKGRHNKFIETKYKLYLFGNQLSEDSHIFFSRLTGYNGFGSFFSTKKLIKVVDEFKPDIIHMHNLHNSYINLPFLFEYIKKSNVSVVWTLHDCWAFTGQCPYFTLSKCNKWVSGCNKCKQYRQYPQSYVDRTKKMWKIKKDWFTNIDNMTIVTPSKWLARLVKKSFLKEYPVKVINNGIDLSIFKPTKNDFIKKHNLSGKKIVLGVSFGWGKRKGLDIFIELSKRLSDNYQIVLVGTDADIDRKLPKNIISINRTNNQEELAALYSIADVYVNPTREDNYPTVNMEALACGTPVITFNTGGSPEMITTSCGVVVECEDIDTLAKKIEEVCVDNLFSSNNCLEQSLNFDSDLKFNEYIDLYNSL